LIAAANVARDAFANLLMAASLPTMLHAREHVEGGRFLSHAA